MIVVGSGSAGGVIAERLGALDLRVLLLEAGPDVSARRGRLNAARTTEERTRARLAAVRAEMTQQPHADYLGWGYHDQAGRQHDYSRMLGGSSAHNGCQSVVGTPRDHALWPDGWQYGDVRPFYLRVIETLGVAPRDRLTMDAGARAFEFAASMHGLPRFDALGLDLNDAIDRGWTGGHPPFAGGVGPHPLNCRGLFSPLSEGTLDKYGGRVSVLETYIESARRNPNIEMLTGAVAHRINFGEVGGSLSARSITVLDPATGRTQDIEADGFVVAASVYGSPALLLRSNIGPVRVATSHNPHVRLRQVGRNLANHPVMLLGVRYSRDIHPQFTVASISVLKEFDDTTNAHAMALVNSPHPSIGSTLPQWGRPFKDLMRNWRRLQFGVVVKSHTLSEGSVNLDDSKPNGAGISFHIARDDLTALADARSEFASLLESINQCDLPAELEGLKVVEIFDVPGCGVASHGTGTCRMGVDPEDSVVDARTLLVHGFDNVWVVDGSIFPAQVHAPHLPISAVALRAAEEFIAPRLAQSNVGVSRGTGSSPCE